MAGGTNEINLIQYLSELLLPGGVIWSSAAQFYKDLVDRAATDPLAYIWVPMLVIPLGMALLVALICFISCFETMCCPRTVTDDTDLEEIERLYEQGNYSSFFPKNAEQASLRRRV